MAALGAEAVRRPFVFPVAGGGDAEVVATVAPIFLATDKQDRAVVDPMIWGDEKRMKRELVVWAKAVASMAATNNTSPSSSPPPLPFIRRGV